MGRYSLNEVQCLWRCGMLVVLMSVITMLGCDEIETVQLTDEDEIRRHLASHSESRELFRSDSLIFTQDYVLSSEPGITYMDMVDSVKRVVVLDISSHRKLKDFGPFLAQDAEAIIEDKIFIRTDRVDGSSVVESSRFLKLNRYGYFIKLGSNSDPYSGWKLMGYGDAYLRTTNMGRLEKPGGLSLYQNLGTVLSEFRYITYDTFYGSQGVDSVKARPGLSDRRYIKLEDIPNMPPDSALIITDGVFNIISAESNSGFVQIVGGGVDTLYIPKPNPNLWNMVGLRKYRPVFSAPDTLKVNDSLTFVPYRVPQ